jgi:hypothetical protein
VGAVSYERGTPVGAFDPLEVECDPLATYGIGMMAGMCGYLGAKGT